MFLILLVKRVVLVAFDQVAIERLESLTPGQVLFVDQLSVLTFIGLLF